MVNKIFIEPAEDFETWETIVDFSEIKKAGVSLEKILNYLLATQPA